jgi:DNA polymerase III delta subunit
MFEAADEWQRPSETDPAVLLGNLHPGDTLGISNELQKLALYTLGREATVDDVDLMCGGDRAARSFEFTDAVQDGNIARAHAVLELLQLDEGMESPQLFATLLTSYRQLGQVLDLLADGANEEAIGIAINRKWAAGRQTAIRRARNLGPEGVHRAFEIIVAADRANKQGDIAEPVAIDLAIAQLCLLAKPVRSR